MRTGSTKHRKSGFTLVELLVVIGIIGLLMALLMPALSSAKRSGLRTRARGEILAIETAMQQYLNDYGKYPMQTMTSSDLDYRGGAYINLVKILRADPTFAQLGQFNPRKNVYLQVKETSISATGAVMDPWDREYRVVADWNFNNECSQYAPAGGGARVIRGQSVIVWSEGEKTTDATDNITSFEE